MCPQLLNNRTRISGNCMGHSHVGARGSCWLIFPSQSPAACYGNFEEPGPLYGRSGTIRANASKGLIMLPWQRRSTIGREFEILFLPVFSFCDVTTEVRLHHAVRCF